MAHVEVMINGRNYVVACDDGQEGHVTRLSRYVDQKVVALSKSVGQVGDARLLLLASLIIADELAETDQSLHQARQEAAAAAQEREQERARAANGGGAHVSADEAVLARALHGLADRIETIADDLARD